MKSRLWYAAILERHLDSTTRCILGYHQNKEKSIDATRRYAGRIGAQRLFAPTPFGSGMIDEGVYGETDHFLECRIDSTVDLPFNRDSYYRPQPYLPHRSWVKLRNAWLCVPDDQHERDAKLICESFHLHLPRLPGLRCLITSRAKPGLRSRSSTSDRCRYSEPCSTQAPLVGELSAVWNVVKFDVFLLNTTGRLGLL